MEEKMRDSIEPFQLERSRATLVVIDVQQKLVPSMPQNVYREVLRSIDFLVNCCDLLKIPVTVTEQYPKGLGPTIPELAGAGGQPPIEKVDFGCCGEGAFNDRLTAIGRSQVLVTGMEAHVCVYQTVLGLLTAGYQVHLVRDAIVSRGKTDYLNTLDLARQAGAIITTAETAVFQMLEAASAPEFKPVSALVKARFANR
jgi:nicotinamidase-related amidase